MSHQAIWFEQWITVSPNVSSSSRLRRSQHHLQHVSGSESQLQQPVGRRLRRGVQTEALDSVHLLFLGSFLLEKAREKNDLDLKDFSLFFYIFVRLIIFPPLLGKRFVVGLSTKVGLERWLLIPASSSLAAARKNRSLWRCHRCPHFLLSYQETQIPVNAFVEFPPWGYSWHPPGFVSSGRPHFYSPFRSVHVYSSFFIWVFLNFCIELSYLFYKKKKKRKKNFGALVLFIGLRTQMLNSFVLNGFCWLSDHFFFVNIVLFCISELLNFMKLYKRHQHFPIPAFLLLKRVFSTLLQWFFVSESLYIYYF